MRTATVGGRMTEFRWDKHYEYRIGRYMVRLTITNKTHEFSIKWSGVFASAYFIALTTPFFIFSIAETFKKEPKIK